MSATTISNTANGGPSSPPLPAPEIGGHHAAVAMAVAPVPSPPAAVGPAAGRVDDIVRALAFAEEPTAAVLAQTANGSSNITGGSSSTNGGQGGESADVSVFAKGEDPESCVQPSRAAEESSSGAAVGHCSGGASSATSRSPGVPASSGSTKANWHDRRDVASTTSSANSGRIGIAENDTATASARGADARVNRGTAAGPVGAGDESDAGSVDEDNDDYTWFSSEKRVSGGERKHGRGRLGGGRVYDRVRITDHAEEINTLKQQLADGSIEESDGREKIRELEAKTFTIKIGDTIEIRSGSDEQPFVGKLVLLDRGTRRFRVTWYFVRHEVDEQLAKDMEPKEILLSDCLSAYQLLDTVGRKVDIVRRRPHAQELPANTYLCYRGYDMKAKMIVPLLEDGSLEKCRRGKPNTKKSQASARGTVSPGASSAAAAHTPPRASTSSSIMSPSNPSQEDNDPSELVLLQRWNRTGPEFDVDVPKWTEPAERLKPPPEEQIAAQSRFDDCQQWSTEALPFEPDALKEYLARAKAIAPTIPGTIVYIRPRPDGQWGDGKTVKQVRRPNGSGRAGSGSSAGLDTGAGPRLSSMARSTYRWGLVAEPPLPLHKQQLTREQIPSRTEALPVHGAPSIPMMQEPATGSTGVGMPMTPQWFRQQQHHLQYMQFQQQRQQQLMQQQLVQQQLVQQQLVQQYQRHHNISGDPFRPRVQLPPNSLLQSSLIQQGSNLGGLPGARPMAANGIAPASTPRAGGNPHALAPSSVPGGAMATGGARATNEDSVVWIASPSEGSSPLQVERSRVVGREFEEEAMNILWDARGKFGVALDIISSKRYQDDLKERLKNAGEIWTFQQVKAAVKTCTKLAAERRNEEMGELGDECTDEADYGVASKPFRCVVDFSRRFATLSRFGQNTKRRGTSEARTLAQGAAAAAASTTTKRQRPKPGTYNDARPHKKRASGGGSGSDRSCKQEQRYREEEEEEEEEETDSSEDDNYDPNESEGSSVIFVRGNKRRQRSKHRRVETGSGDSSPEDRKDNVASTTTTRSRKPTSPPLDPSPGVIHDLCSSDEEDEMRDLPRDGPTAASADAPAAAPSPGTAGRSEHEGYQATAPATAAEVEAAATARETRGVAAEAAAMAEADVENGGPAAAAGAGGGGAGMPSACPKDAHGIEMSAKREGDGSGEGSDVTPPARDDSPVPGVASGNTGGEAMATRPQRETGSVLHLFMDRCKATLTPELFDKFVSALSQYREQRLAIGELVDVVGQCFNHLEEREVKLVNEFNSFLPPGNAVKITKA